MPHELQVRLSVDEARDTRKPRHRALAHLADDAVADGKPL